MWEIERHLWRIIFQLKRKCWQFPCWPKAQASEALSALPKSTGIRSCAYDEHGNGLLHDGGGLGYGSKYRGGKWGKYLRAPNLYFEIMDRLGKHFVPVGEITAIRFGVKSGCDAFFMPRDVSADFLEKYSSLEWNDAPLHSHCKRSEVENGKVKLIEAGDNTVHPVESEYLAPEVHSLMNISRPLL